MCTHRIIDDRIKKSIKGKRIWHNLRLLWLLYRTAAPTDHICMYPAPGLAWGMGVVGGCARAIPAPLPLLRHSSLRQSYFEKTKT